MSPWMFNGWNIGGGEDGNGNEESETPWRLAESGDRLASCMQVTWFYVVSRRRNGG